MNKNIGNTDRFVHILTAALIIALYFDNIIEGTLGIVLLVLAGILVATSTIRFCPLYLPFGINTCSGKQRL